MVCVMRYVCYYCVMGLFRGAAIHEINLQNSTRATADPSFGVEWQAGAACGPDNAELFLPPESGRIPKKHIERAKRICRDCPVVSECLEHALSNNLNETDDGIRGGMTPIERRELKNQNNQ